MKKLLSLLLSVLMLFGLTGCFSNNYDNGELQIFMPGEYIDEAVVENFEYEYGIKVNITLFDTNEAMYTKLQASSSSYDIIIPSDYMIERMIKEKMIQKLDYSKLTCIDAIYDGVKGMAFDPNMEYSIPYFWGNAGIVFDETLVDYEDVINEEWDVFKNPKYKGMIYMYDSIRDIFMTAYKSLGYSMNTSNEQEIKEAYEYLCEIAENMEPAYASDECIDGLAYGEKAMGFMYSGDAAYILSENENMRFYAPVKMGTNYFVDAMVIPNNAKNIDNAYKFMNYITDYDAAYENSSTVGYCSVNAEVLNDITLPDADFDGNEAYVPRDKMEIDEVFRNDEVTLAIMSDYWTKVKLK